MAGSWPAPRVAALSEPPGFESTSLADKLTTARFYGEQLLPMANGLAPAVKGGASLLKAHPFEHHRSGGRRHRWG